MSFLTVYNQWLLEKSLIPHTQGEMSDRSSKQPFAASRNLQNAKNIFIEAET